jgi:uncharacterized protein (TIGR03067 family)
MSLGTVGSAWSLFLAAVALSSLAVAQDASPVRAEKEKLKGTWFMEGTHYIDGKDRKEAVKYWLRLTFTEEKALIETDSEPKGKVEQYKLNPTKSPKELDIGQGETVKEFIYKLHGDKLTIAFPFPELVSGGTFAERQRHILRPRDFKETKETAAPIVLILKRIKQ